MIKIKALYTKEEEKKDLLNTLQEKFNILKISKEYKKESPYARIHIDLKEK